MHDVSVLVDKKYVHKYNIENVFLCNLRRALPFTIDREIFQQGLIEFCNEEENWFLQQYYVLNSKYRESDGSCAGNECYVLRYLPEIQILSFEKFEKLLQEKTTIWEKELLTWLYIRKTAEEKIYYQLRDDISEPFENFLIFSMKLWHLYINNEERHLIAQILEKFVDTPKMDVYYANMFVNTDHLFFFEHPNDHVPGMMMIETIRQFIVACGHVYGNAPMDGTQLILNSLECQFLSYININYPILLRGTAVEFKLTRDGYWQHVTLQIEVFQNSRCMALFNVKGTCISSKLFERIRRNQIAEMKSSRFIPLVDEKCSIEFLVPDRKIRVSAELVNLSVDGLSIRMSSDCFSPGQSDYEISLLFGQGDSIRGRYKKVWHNQLNSHTTVGLTIVELGAENLAKMHSLITRNCIALEERQLY